MKKEIEEIFVQAVALDQSGGLRNTIYAVGREIFILNYDHTVLLRFRVPEVAFHSPVCFRANDYDSSNFAEENGKIIFTSEKSGFTRTKTVGGAEYSPEEIQTLFGKFFETDPGLRNHVEVSKDILELLDEELSHIEFSGKAEETMKMIQRNVYSGGIIQVQEKMGEGMGFNTRTLLTEDFGPIGIKTGDFMSLFRFFEVLRFDFPSNDSGDFIVVRSTKRDDDKAKGSLIGIIAGCLYDEIIKIKEVRHGRQK